MLEASGLFTEYGTSKEELSSVCERIQEEKTFDRQSSPNFQIFSSVYTASVPFKPV